MSGSMSYLGPLRIHFAGRFRATPATVNNDPANYGRIGGQADEGFNPTGDSAGGCSTATSAPHFSGPVRGHPMTPWPDIASPTPTRG